MSVRRESTQDLATAREDLVGKRLKPLRNARRVEREWGSPDPKTIMETMLETQLRMQLETEKENQKLAALRIAVLEEQIQKQNSQYDSLETQKQFLLYQLEKQQVGTAKSIKDGIDKHKQKHAEQMSRLRAENESARKRTMAMREHIMNEGVKFEDVEELVQLRLSLSILESKNKELEHQVNEATQKQNQAVAQVSARLESERKSFGEYQKRDKAIIEDLQSRIVELLSDQIELHDQQSSRMRVIVENTKREFTTK